MRTKLYLVTIGIAIALVATSCNKKSSSPTAPQSSTPPAFPSVTVKGPNTTSTDSHAQLAVTYSAEVNALANSALFGAFAGLNPAQTGSTWTWTVVESTLTVTFTETQNADGSISWSWKENGTDPSTHVTYSNWVFFSGTRSADGKSGEWKVYNDNTTILAADFTWSTSASNVFTGTLQGYNSSGVLTDKIVVINNADGSGEVDAWNATVLVFKATWVAAGTGTWTTYDSTTGAQTATGTWS